MNIEATIQANRQLVHEEKAKLDQLSIGPIQSNIDQLEARKIDLIAELEECNAELDLEKQKLADLSSVVKEQKSRLRSAIKNVADMTKSLKVIPGTDAQRHPSHRRSRSNQATGFVGYLALSVSMTLCVIDSRNFCNRLRNSGSLFNSS
jgi:chromosome segregation ATPase